MQYDIFRIYFTRSIKKNARILEVLILMIFMHCTRMYRDSSSMGHEEDTTRIRQAKFIKINVNIPKSKVQNQNHIRSKETK